MKSIGINTEGEEVVFEGEIVRTYGNRNTPYFIYINSNRLNNDLTAITLNDDCKSVFCTNIDIFNVKPKMYITIMNYIK